MSEITMSDSIDLQDPKIKAVAKRVLNTFLIASEKAVASQHNPQTYKITSDPTSPEQIFLSRFKELDAVTQKNAKTKVMKNVNASKQIRSGYFGDLAEVSLKSDVAVLNQVHALKIPDTLKFPMDYLKTMELHDGILPGGFIPMQTTNKLEFRIHKVRCVDETNPEWWGDDEIAMGGTTIDETGDTKKVPQFTVRNDFDDGEQKVYSPPKQFTSFNLLEGAAWPKSYFVTLVLAEVDMGGLAEYLNKLLDAVKKEVISALTAALGAAIGASGGIVGAIIGAVVGWIVGKIFEWLKSWWSDDIFPPRTLSVSIPSLTSRWSGGATNSPDRVVRFSGHGGIYDVTYDWRMYS